MATVIEEFVARLGWDVDTKEIEKFNKSFGRVKSIASGIAKVVSLAAGAITGYATIVGRQIAVNTNLAKSVGLSVEAFEGLAGVVEGIGLSGDNVVDLVEELNNKFGEKKGLGQFTAVEESLKILKLDFKEIRDLKPEEQFIQILDAARGLGDAQKATSAVDMLMGGEANKILGFLRTQDETLEEIIYRRKQLNLLDEDAREGAVKFTNAMNEFNFVLKSLGGLIFGILGDSLRPMIGEFLTWVAANRELVKTNIVNMAESLASALRSVVKVVKTLLGWIWKAVDAVGGFDKALFLLSLALGGLLFGQAVMALRAFMTAVKAATLVQTLYNIAVAAIPALIALAVVAIGLLAEDLYQFFTGGESVFGDFLDFVNGGVAEMSKVVEGYIDDLVTSWASAMGMNKDEFQLMLADMLEPLEQFIIEVDKQIQAVFDYFYNFTGGFGDFIEDMIGKAIGLFRELKNTARENIDGIIGFLKGLPLVGGLFGSDTGTGGTPRPSPSAGVVNNSSQSATNVTQRTNINAPINVTAAPGQSAEDIGRAVARELGRQTSTAVRNNNTGVEY